MSVVTLTLRSYQELRYNAAVSPRKSASGTATKAATPARNSVFFNLGAIISTTSRDRSCPEAERPEKDVPRSPRATLVNQSRYLSGAGLSSPSSLLNAATVSSVAACPRTASPKSPGNREIELKMIAETTNNVMTPNSSRLMMVTRTGCKYFPT